MSRHRARPVRGQRAQGVREDPRRLRSGARARRRGCRWPAAREQPLQDRLVGLHAADAQAARHPHLQELQAGRAGALHRLDAVLPDLGAAGQYPRIFEDNVVGPEAKKLFDDAQAHAEAAGRGEVADRQCGDRLLAGQRSRRRHRAVRGRRRASPGSPCCTRCASRWRARTGRDRANTALADFVAPKESGLADYIGAFAVTTGIGEAEALARHIDATDDYGRIMLKALADRLAEAFAERMHERVRREFWGYAPGEKLSPTATDRGGVSRHPPGARLSGPARPHREGHHLPPARRGERKPASSSPRASPCGRASAVSGLYFAHPESHYFGVGKVERDQVEDYAARKGWTVEEAERWLSPGAQLRSPSPPAARRPDSALPRRA